MFNSIAGRTIAFYPSPAGATESALSLGAWHDVEEANPWVRVVAPREDGERSHAESWHAQTECPVEPGWRPRLRLIASSTVDAAGRAEG